MNSCTDRYRRVSLILLLVACASSVAFYVGKKSERSNVLPLGSHARYEILQEGGVRVGVVNENDLVSVMIMDGNGAGVEVDWTRGAMKIVHGPAPVDDTRITYEFDSGGGIPVFRFVRSGASLRKEVPTGVIWKTVWENAEEPVRASLGSGTTP